MTAMLGWFSLDDDAPERRRAHLGTIRGLLRRLAARALSLEVSKTVPMPAMLSARRPVCSSWTCW